MSFPPTYLDLVEDPTFGDNVVFTDIHVDPASLPAPAPVPMPAINDNISDEDSEMEDSEEDPEEDSEEDPEEDPEPEEEEPEEEPMEEAEPEPNNEPNDPAPVIEPVEAIPSFYAPGGSRPRTMRTARKSVRFPSTNYASSSRAHGPPNPRFLSPTPSPSPSPSPSPESSRPITPRFNYSPTSPLSSPPFPGDIPESAMPVRIPSPYNPTMTAEEWVTYLPAPPTANPRSRARGWIEQWQNTQPTLRASTSTAPPPQPHADPVVSQLIGRVSNIGHRVTQLEDNVEILPGPAQLEDLDLQVQDMDERVNRVEHRAYEMSNRVLAPGALADTVQIIQTRLQAMEAENDRLRSRIRELEQHIFDIHYRH